jgi:hypothetical protein
LTALGFDRRRFAVAFAQNPATEGMRLRENMKIALVGVAGTMIGGASGLARLSSEMTFVSSR